MQRTDLVGFQTEFREIPRTYSGLGVDLGYFRMIILRVAVKSPAASV